VEWKSKGDSRRSSVSIVIPTYAGGRRVDGCLKAVTETLPQDFDAEILIVDDCPTRNRLGDFDRWSQHDHRVRILPNASNLGFIGSCNKAAEAATGDVLVFLNDDTVPLPGWLPPLLWVLEHKSHAGAVGGQLLYPDGVLQEAGGVIFRDGTGANFGRGDYNPERPLFNYLREVDYCSGALLATRRTLFHEMGGFDTRFCPAYYEDTDYCFQLRARGLRTYYQPASRVVHLEGATSGTCTTTGVKRFQEVNHSKFVRKWKHLLKSQPARPPGFDLATWHALANRSADE
jgi:GT2 family glycosyltransferase